jgi:hypothetical protein
VRIRCPDCHRIRVLFRENRCRSCWKKQRPLFVVATLDTGERRYVNSAWLARKRGNVRGAEVMRASGRAYTWDAESARAAALKMWRQRPVNKRIGVRLKGPFKRPTPKPSLIKRIVSVDTPKPKPKPEAGQTSTVVYLGKPIAQKPPNRRK